MRVFKNRFLVILILASLPSVIFARRKPVSRKTIDTQEIIGNTAVADEIEKSLENLPQEDAWSKYIIEHGPTYGNYCGAGKGDPFYEEPCLSRLDCICKAHDFGYSLRKYLEADKEMVEQIMQHPLVVGEENPDYEPFIQLMALTFFAGKLAGKNMFDTLTGAYQDFSKKPKKSLDKLKSQIDHSEVFKQKMVQIAKERNKFETGLKVSTTPSADRTMSLSVKPLGFLLGILALDYEAKLSDAFSLRLGGSVLGAGLAADTNLNYLNNRSSSFALSIGGKIYYYGKPMKRGLYIEPRVEGSYEGLKKACCEAARQPAFGVTPMVMVGLDQVFALGFQIDIGVGLGYYFGFPLEEVSGGTHAYRGIVPEMQASVGWAW